MPHNHWGPLINHSSGKLYPMVMVGDFSLVDKIFPGSPEDSLLFNGEELAKLKRKGYQVFKEEKPYPSSPRREKQLSSCALGDVLSSSSREGEPPKTSSNLPRASSPRAPPDFISSKKSSFCHGKSHITSSKHKDKSHSDKSNKHSCDKEAIKSAQVPHVSTTMALFH